MYVSTSYTPYSLGYWRIRSHHVWLYCWCHPGLDFLLSESYVVKGLMAVCMCMWGEGDYVCMQEVKSEVRVDLDLPEYYADWGRKYFLHGLDLGFCPRQAKWVMLPDHPGRGQADPASRGLKVCRFVFLTRCPHSERDPKGAKEVPGTLTHGWGGAFWELGKD